MNFLNVLLMAPPSEDSNPLTSFLPIILVFVVIYFFMMRPQIKRQKELTNFRKSLNKNDKVLTTGGIYGRIVEVKEKYVVVEIAKEITIKVDKSAVLKDATDIEQPK